jgi:hypothetical protein
MMSSGFGPYRGTSACAKNPADPACTSCAFAGGDPACAPAAQFTAPTRTAGDPPANANIRHVRMKQNFGIDQQYPIGRYVNGLTEAKVPDRSHEYPSNATTYDGSQPNCSNPIFSRDLPDGSNLDPDTLCNLSPGTRSPDLVPTISCKPIRPIPTARRRRP